ncbi:hypothetical protein, partial [Helcococcus bovis]|uniref:hypothetical protein n=1 Tax=Helcococcus bovis TaxID=3153252 RepID=UPI0038BD8627
MKELQILLQKEIEKHLIYYNYVKNYKHLQGRLVESSSHGRIQFYHEYFDKNIKKKVRKYLKKNDKLIPKLAQQEYIQEIQTYLEKLLEKLSSTYSFISNTSIDHIYNQLSKEKKKLITPIVTPYKQFKDEWLNKPYTKKPFTNNTPLILTNRKERVRSKSEKILADYFDRMNIPYKYECPIKIGEINFNPDFTFLNPVNNREIYWEHFGMMDNPDYVKNFVDKINIYYKNGIILGQNLLVTFENTNSYIDNEIVKLLVNKY